MKRLTFTRTSSIQLEKLSPEEINSLYKIHRWKGFDLKRAKASRDFFRSATFLTYQQYMDLVHKRPYLSNQLQFLRLSWEKTIEWLIIITDSKVIVNPFKALHVYTNNCNFIKVYQSIKGDYCFFDQNLSFNFLCENLYLKPDWIILKNDGQTVFIETDMGSESFKRLRWKNNYYMKFISEIVNRRGIWFEYFKIKLFTISYKRINHLRKKQVFRELEVLSLIEYWINNT